MGCLMNKTMYQVYEMFLVCKYRLESYGDKKMMLNGGSGFEAIYCDCGMCDAYNLIIEYGVWNES